MAAYIGNKRFQLTTALNGLGGPVKWGEITGQISDQADLQQEFQEVSALIMTEGIQQLGGIVKNGKMTVYQGNVEKGQFSANQNSDLSIFLDPPSSGGGGDIPADLSCNNLSAANSVSLWGAPGARATNQVLIGLPGKISTPDTSNYRTIVINTHNSAIASAHGAGTLNICCGNSDNGNPEDTAANILLGNKDNATTLDEYIRQKAYESSGDKYYLVGYSPDTWRQEGSYIQLNTGYSMYSQGLIYFTVKAQNTVSFTISWIDTMQQQQTESFDLINEQNYSNVCMQFLILCNFSNSVEITSNDGNSMTVDVYYKIEAENVYG